MRWVQSLLPFVGLWCALSCGARSNLKGNAGSASGAGGAAEGAGGAGTSSTGGGSGGLASGGSGAGGLVGVGSVAVSSASSTTTASSASSTTSTTTGSSASSTSSTATASSATSTATASSATSTATASSTSSTATASSSSGAGGSGPVTACNSVEVAMPILTVADATGNLTQPSLVVVDTAPPTAAVVFAEQAFPTVMGPTAQVGAFDGWGAWPPPAPVVAAVMNQKAGGIVPTGPVPGVSILAGSLADSPVASSFGLLYSDAGGVWTYAAWAVGTDGAVITEPAQAAGGDALMFAPNPSLNAFLGGVAAHDGSNYALDMLFSTSNQEGNIFNAGCATAPVAADASPVPDGWLLAVALGTKLTWGSGGVDCSVASSQVGPPTSIQLAKVDAMGTTVSVTQTVQVGAAVTRLRMTPGPLAAWAVWSLDGSPALSGAEITPSPSFWTTFQVVAQTGTLVPLSFAVESLDDLLVVAAVDRVSGSPDQIQVTAVNGTGAGQWLAMVPTGGTVDGALTVRAAPDGSAVLVAWAELPAGGTQDQLRIARIDCLP
jgi:hypothetical protein